MNNNFKLIDDIVFVGGTLWTDYKLLDKNAQDMYMWYATRNLNDCRYGKFNPYDSTEKEDTRLLRRLQPEDCVKMGYC